MKSKVIPVITGVMCVSLLMGACGENGAKQSVSSESSDTKVSAGQSSISTTESGSTSASASSEGGKNWISDDTVKLKFWSMKEDNIEDLNKNEFIKWIEQECNVDIEFEQSSSAEALQKFNVSLASGSYPDVYFGCNQITGMNSTIMNSTLMKFGKSGIFIPLNELIEKYGVNTKDLMNSVSYIKNGITMPDGNIYALPIYSEIYHCRYSQKLWIDPTWLNNLNLKMPQTTDDFYEVLKAFKEKDANGNGDTGDEIPLAGCINAWHSDPTSFLLGAFIYDDGDKRMMVNDNKVDSILDKEEYKEGLKYVNKLYSEGLIYSETYSQTSDQMKSIASQSPNIVGCTSIGAPMAVMDAASEIYKNAVTVPPLKGPKGVQTCGYYGYSDLRVGAYIITKECKNPEAAFKLADFMYSLDSSIRLRQGIKGSDWRDAETGEKTFDGKGALYARITPLVTDGGAQNNHMGNTGVFRETNDSFIGAWAVGNDFDIRSLNGIEQLLIEQTLPYDGYEPKQTLPPVVFTDEEAEIVTPIETEVRKYADEQRVLFITGKMDLDKDWDTYINELKKLELDKMVEIYNTAYERQYVK